MKYGVRNFVRTVCIFTSAICLLTSSISIGQYTKIHDLTGSVGSEGASPYGDLISVGTYLYGAAQDGGTSANCPNGCGVVFKIKPDGSGYANILNFIGLNMGSHPFGSLIYYGSYLYGTTNQGGINNAGTIFRVTPSGSSFLKIHDFSNADGSFPMGSLISDGTFLYGMTSSGGTNNVGVIFRIMPDGTAYDTLFNFIGTSGAYPNGSLYSDGTYLYGMTNQGGANYFGTVFKIKLDGTGFTKLLDFDGPSNGRGPSGSLISDGTYLYGLTGYGGANNMGVIFKIKKDGSGYSKLLDFSGAGNGDSPYGSLFSMGTFLYGMTIQGGSNNQGTLFKIRPNGTGFNKLVNLNNTNGSYPRGSLIYDGTYFYGMTAYGGTSGKGAIFNYVPPLVNDIISSANVSCFGGNNGSATCQASGGFPPYTYFWNPTSQTTPSATGLSAGNYAVTVTDANGSSLTTNVTIQQPAVLSVTINSTNVSCPSGNDATATANPAGGTVPYTFQWNDGQTTAVATGLSVGTYTLTTLDSNNCVATNTISITNISLLTPAICAVTVDSLSNFNVIVWDKSSYITGDTFFVYRDTANNAYGLIGKVPYDSLSMFTDTVRTLYAANGDPNATSWKYKIEVKDTCGNVSTLSPYHKTLFIQNNSGNFSWNDYQIEGQPVPVPSLQNYLFQRDNFSNGNWTTIQTLSASSLSFTDGAYSIYQNTATWRVRTVWNISCTPTVIDPKNPSINATNLNTSRSNNMRNSIICTASITGNTTICAGQSTTLTASGGVFYSWSNGYTTTSIIVSPTATTAYSVTATTGTCVATASVTVTVNPMPTASISGNTTICSGDAATLTATGGGTYSWSNGATSAVIYPSAPGTFSVIASVGSCSDTASATVTTLTLPSVSASSTQAGCGIGNGTATANPSGGCSPFTYLWSISPPQYTQTATGLSAGIYSVTVTDCNGCTNSESVTVSGTSAPTVSATVTDASCASCCDGNATANPSGGTPPYTYSWSNGGSTQFVSGLCVGSYTVCITDANGCTTCSNAIVNFAIGTSQITNLTSEISISPNPTSGICRLTLPHPSADGGTVEIYSVLGMKIFSSPIGGGWEGALDLRAAPDGIYFVRVKTENGIANKKIIINSAE